MSSQRMLEIVNAIHHRLSENGDKTKPFGGKQIILVGEFLQLRPVPEAMVQSISANLLSSKASRIKELHAERKETVFDSIFLFSLYLSRDWSYITKGRQNAPVGSSGKSKIFNGKF